MRQCVPHNIRHASMDTHITDSTHKHQNTVTNDQTPKSTSQRSTLSLDANSSFKQARP